MYTGLGPLGAGIAARSEAPASLAVAVEEFADQPSWPLHTGGVPRDKAGQCCRCTTGFPELARVCVTDVSAGARR